MLTRMMILSLSIVSLVGCSSPTSTPSVSTPAESPIKSQSKIVENTDRSEQTIEQQKVSASLKQSQQEYELLTQSMSGRQKTIYDLTTQVNKLDTELSDFNNRVNLYMLDNKAEVVCMGALGMSMDESNQYSKGAKDLAAATTIGCGVGVLSDGKFAGNVGKVFNELVKANTRANSLKQELSDVRSKLSQETNAFELEKTKADTLASDMKR